MVLQVKRVADLFDEPDKPATFNTTINVDDNTPLTEISRTADGNFIKVEAHFPTQTVTGFVRAVDVVEVTNLKPEPADLFSFVYFSTVASETFNQRLADASAGVSRDYILALALVLNGLEEKGLTEEVLQEFDPFHFTEPEWKKFCESGGNTSNYQDFDRFDPLAQIDGAVFFTSQLTSKIVHSLTDPGDMGDPHIPNSMDLFLVHMLGDAGVAALKDLAMDSSRGSKPWESFLSAAGDDAAALKKLYPKFLDGQDKTSVAQVLGLIETAFGKAYENVAEIVPGVLPEEAPPTGGPPKWLEIARGEQARGVKAPDMHIVDYFKATDFGPGATPSTPWCGAFAGFCIKSAGQPVPTGAAAARSWNKWGKPFPIGTPADKIPPGAVVVFSRGTDPKKGHVSFFVGGDPKNVRVLGGNQHHEVKETVFPRSNIIGIRLPGDMAIDLSKDMPSGASMDMPSGKGPVLRKLKDANLQRSQNMHVHSQLIPQLDVAARRLIAPVAKARYQAISTATQVPWYIIAIIHEREASQKFDRNLAQGDPWNKVSTRVPKGRGPFASFEAAAIDALTKCHPFAARWKDWTFGGAMTLLEQYNGLGYANRGLPSPYIWASTDQYVRGKFVRDGVFDPNFVDRQFGCAALLTRMKVADLTIVI